MSAPRLRPASEFENPLSSEEIEQGVRDGVFSAGGFHPKPRTAQHTPGGRYDPPDDDDEGEQEATT